MTFKLLSPVYFVAELVRALYARFRGYEVLAAVDVEEARLEKCLDCEFLDPDSEQCTICTCFVRAKAMVAVSKCPIGKWDAVWRKKSLTKP